MLTQLTVGGSRPARRVSTAEPRDHPPQLRERGMPKLIEPAFDELPERGPAWLAVLAGDGQLSVMEGSELADGQAAPGLQLQITEVRLAGKRTRLIRHGSPSSCPRIRGIGREDHKDQSCGSSPYAAGELEALPADPGAAGTTTAYGIPVMVPFSCQADRWHRPWLHAKPFFPARVQGPERDAAALSRRTGS